MKRYVGEPDDGSNPVEDGFGRLRKTTSLSAYHPRCQKV